MFLRVKRRFKDGKEHRYWSIVENHRTVDNHVVQRHVLYLGEINDGQQASWVKTIEVIQRGERQGKQMALFPADCAVPELACEKVQIHLSALELHRPRQWGACWLACQLWNLLDLDGFWTPRLPPSRKKTRSILEKFAALQMVDVHLPTTNGRRFILSRYTQPDKDQKLLLHQLKLTLPQEPPPCLAVKESSVPN